MKKNPKDNSKLIAQLQAVKDQLTTDSPSESLLCDVALGLNQVGDLAREDSNGTLQRGAELLARVSELAASWSDDQQGDEDLSASLVTFLAEHVGVLDEVAEGKDRSDDVESFIALANENWNEYLDLFETEGFGNPDQDDWLDDSTVTGEADVGEEASDDQIKLMLAALAGSPVTDGAAVNEKDLLFDVEPNAIKHPDARSKQARKSGNLAVDADASLASRVRSLPSDADLDAAAKKELANDRELLEAYLDDALRCLSSMEQAAMKVDDTPSDHDSGRQFCRELHTLKGASASVGLRGLASELHELESSLETMFANESEGLNADPLYAAVDSVRNVIDALQNGDQPREEPSVAEASETSAMETSAPVISTSPVPRAKPDFGSFASHDDASIRIRASKLDRLMDMLAELVVLRNRRESHINEFNELNGELVRCSARVSFADEQMGLSNQLSDVGGTTIQRSSSNMSEVAKDISAVSQGLRDLQKPVIQDNAAISRFIRDFRHELMQLRRIPVSGLFSRLQRAARDAAKSEQKKVRVVLQGEHCGLEQEIQERLYDSMLHVVRNSVSHGVELPEDRNQAGKEETGTITLEATSNAQLLMIEVRDDGGGIDYDAVRRRGIEKGLISADQRPTDDQLARLIFHSGFSTREQASEISGRGVGMDVVATTIEQMHGRIEIESVSGIGTTMRLLIPLRTGIDHVMVFRSGGQLFALPMQAVTAAKSAKAAANEGVETISLATALSIRCAESSTVDGEVLLIRHSSSSTKQSSDRQLAIAIDELVGPEEVVVRGLPDVLRSHPLMNGITLSGSGQKVLLLDSDRLVEFCANHELDLSVGEATGKTANAESNQKCVLVVDDSLTARKVLGKLLRQQGLAVVEASDGIEAIEKLRRDSFDLVLTDLDMPRMGGLELLSDIQSGGYSDAPRVIVSSRNEDKFRDQASEAGACEFLNKPVSKSTVVQMLEQLELLPAT